MIAHVRRAGEVLVLTSHGANAGLQVERLSALLSVAIGLAEVLLGLFVNSIALVSDGISSFADASVSTIVWLGLKVARRGRDGKFHFGYYRAETISSMVSAVVMAVVALLILYESYISLVRQTTVKATEMAALVAIIAAVPSFYLGYRKRHVSRSSKSASVSLDAYNSILGGVSSLIAFFGIYLSGIGIYWGDATAGMLIACLIFIVAYSALKEGSLVLMDACMCPDVMEIVKEIVNGVREVRGVHDIRLRRTGPYITGEIHVEVDGDLMVSQGDAIAAEIERRLRSSFDDLHMVTVKVESGRHSETSV